MLLCTVEGKANIFTLNQEGNSGKLFANREKEINYVHSHIILEKQAS